MDLIEKVARAICEERTWPGAWMRANELETAAWSRDARAAIAETLTAVEAHLSAVQYDPAPYTAMKRRLSTLRKEALGDES